MLEKVPKSPLEQRSERVRSSPAERLQQTQNGDASDPTSTSAGMNSISPPLASRTIVFEPGQSSPCDSVSAATAAVARNWQEPAGTTPGSHSDDASSFYTASQGSLPQFENTRIRTGTDSTPVVIPLPAVHADSDGTENGSHQADQLSSPPLQRRRRVHQRTYWHTVDRLSRCLPHLRDLCSKRRRYKRIGKVVCADYARASPIFTRSAEFSVSDVTPDELKDCISNLRDDLDPGLAKRVILVEDICLELIECLGTTFQIDPDFFASHLDRSGSDGADYEQKTSKVCSIDGSPKAHASLKWYRPVQQNPKVSEWLTRPSSLLSTKLVSENGEIERLEGSLRWLDPALNPDGSIREKRVEHQLIASTNIFRCSTMLSTGPATHEERQEDAKRKSPRRSRKNRLGNAEVEAGPLEEEENEPRLNRNPKWGNDAMSTAWEERATWFKYDRENAPPIVIILLDPLPAITDYQTIRYQGRARIENNASGIERRREKIDMSYSLAPRSPAFLPFNKYHATREQINRYDDAINDVPSTCSAIVEWTRHFDPQDGGSTFADPVYALLQIVRKDSKIFFRNLELALEKIAGDSLDDYLIARRLDDWRELMNYFEIEVPAMRDSLREFLAVVFPVEIQEHNTEVGSEFQSRQQESTSQPKEVREIVTDLEKDIARVSQRIEKAYTNLRSDMAFAESRRSIVEAESVAKLTELAFVFIPLSFTCSLFSISIHQLRNGVPAWTFVLTAILLTMLSYVIRLVVTSELFADSKRTAIKTLRKGRDLPTTRKASMLSILRLTVKEMWMNGGAEFAQRLLMFLGWTASVILPATFVWTSTKLGTGFNVAITCFLVLTALVSASLNLIPSIE